MQKKRRWVGVGLVVAGMAIGIFVQQQSGSCSGSSSSQGTSSGASAEIVHAPTISTQTMRWELSNRQSPLSASDVAFIYQQSESYQIDDAFALADWAAETQDGREAVLGTDNIGNITAPSGVNAAGHTFAVYPTWQAGIAAWFALIERLYIQGGHASDLLTFALYYVDGVTPDQATAAQKQDLSTGYVQTLHNSMASLQAHEQQLTAGTGGGSSGKAGASLTLASLIPATLSSSWAGNGALVAAAQVLLQGCTATGKPGTNPLVLAAMALAAHLESDGASFDRWGPDTPAGVLSQQGTVWCTDFVASTYQLATGQAFPSYPDAALWWDGSVGQHPGFVQIPAGPGSFPQAGDIVVLRDGSAGHVAIIVGVQVPQSDQPGFVLVAQGHATTALEKWTLSPDGTLTPPWQYRTQVPGYIRIPALAGASVASKVQPITQAATSAGWDNTSQHDIYWNAACAPASFVEVARAWGISDVTLGQAVDRLLAHDPVYLTPSGGLMDQAGWDWMAQAFHPQAQVASYAYSFDTLVRRVTSTGAPIIIGIRAASGWSHFLVAVGGDSQQVLIVDSSTHHIMALPRAAFTDYTDIGINDPVTWTGETVLLTPA